MKHIIFAVVACACIATFLHKGDLFAGVCALFLIVYLVAQGRS